MVAVSIHILIHCFYQNQEVSKCVPTTDYSKLLPPPVRTRTSGDICHCLLCSTGRQTLVPGSMTAAKVKDPPVKICPECQGEVAPLVSHVCTRSERNNNIEELLRSVSNRSRGQILSSTLKGKVLIRNIIKDFDNIVYRHKRTVRL